MLIESFFMLICVVQSSIFYLFKDFLEKKRSKLPLLIHLWTQTADKKGKTEGGKEFMV